MDIILSIDKDMNVIIIFAIRSFVSSILMLFYSLLSKLETFFNQIFDDRIFVFHSE